MQVRTFTALLILLSLSLSLLCITYNLIQNRTAVSDQLYASSPLSYFTVKYHSYARQINTIQFAAQIIVITLETAELIFFSVGRYRQKAGVKVSRLEMVVEYFLLCLLFTWQGVVTGYSVQCQREIGYADGNTVGDSIMSVLQGVTFTAILIALITFAYYFTTLHPKTSTTLLSSQADCPQFEDAANSTRGEGRQGNCLREGSNHKQQEINHFKPSYERNLSPMSRMFQNMSVLADDPQPPMPVSSRRPLLDLAQPIDISFKEPSKQEPVKKLKIVVPRLKLGEVRKKETQQDFLYPLNNLEISIIGPQPQHRYSHRSSNKSDSS